MRLATSAAILLAAAILAAPPVLARAQDASGAASDEVPLGEGVELLMVEQAGCIYCARFDAEVSPEYPVTAEGAAAPLRRIDIRSADLAAFDLVSDPVLTPTFVLMRDGVEIARLEGYPGEDFFWGLLDRMLGTAGISIEEAG